MQLNLQRAACAFGLTAMMAAAGASAGIIAEFDLFDHPNGKESPPPYGLRFDGLFGGTDIVTFSIDSFANSKLVIEDNGGNLEIHITGTLFGGTVDGLGGYIAGEAWNYHFAYVDGVMAVADGWMVNTTNPTSNAGTLTNVGDPGMIIDFFGKGNANNTQFLFLSDGHRLDGDDSSWVGRGWVTDLANGNDGLTRDWLFTATPTPGTAVIALSGIAMLGRRRRS